jgi:hypothetical protein
MVINIYSIDVGQTEFFRGRNFTILYQMVMF